MSFAKWKNMSKLLQNFHWMYKKEAERACQAAYKAGERDGRKQVEVMAKAAIALQKKLAGK